MILSSSDFDRLIGEASRLAKSADEKRRVKEAREALFQFRAGRIDREACAGIVARLPLTPPEEAWPIGGFFVESDSTPGAYYLTTRRSCTCIAGKNHKQCSHVRTVRRGEAKWRAVPPEFMASVAADPFERIKP